MATFNDMTAHVLVIAAVVLLFSVGATLTTAITPSYDEALWFDPRHDLTYSVLTPTGVRLAANSSLSSVWKSAQRRGGSLVASEEAIKWCEEQGGEAGYHQYSFVRGPDVVPYGRQRAFCFLGQYTITEVETLASPFLTLAQMAYVHPLDDFKWDKSKWGNPATQYCYECGGAANSIMFIPERAGCEGTGWSILPAEASPGIFNACEFADGSSIDEWALYNGQKWSTAKRITPHFRVQIKGKHCMGPIR